MKQNKWSLPLNLFFISVALALLCRASLGSEKNVILITLDGVRWQEFFGAPDPQFSQGDMNPVFPYFHENLLQRGVVFGNRYEDHTMSVSNSTILSLPAYQSIFAGSVQSCYTNSCGRISVETFPERLVRELKLPSDKVVTIASWKNIAFAVEHVEGTTLVNSGNEILKDETVKDKELNKIDFAQLADQPQWDDVRYDRHTFAQAMRILKTHKPRFLYISFNDSDQWAHAGEYLNYLASLRQFDQWISEIVKTVSEMEDYGKNTVIMVTTDHGRGEDSGWKHHGFVYPSSKNIFLYATGAGVNSVGSVAGNSIYTHLDIRPTIEKIFGLEPIKCDGCGSPILEIVGDAPMQDVQNK